jgi:pantothenate synthetase
MHLYLKYQSPNTFGSKDITQVKVFQNLAKIQDQNHKVKIVGTKRNVFS